jgi:hypothetical protein
MPADYGYNPKAGDGLEKISAEALGDALDAGRGLRRASGGPAKGRGVEQVRNAVVAFYANNSDEDLDIGLAVPVNASAVALPTGGDASPACSNPILQLTGALNFDSWIRHNGQIGITLEPIDAGSVGRVAVAGLVYARITGERTFPNLFAAVPLPNGSGEFVGVLELEPHGFYVVEAESGTGKRWALINMITDGLLGCRGGTTGELSQGGSCECSIRTLEHGSTEGTDSPQGYVTAYDWFLDNEQTLPAGARVRLEWSKQDHRWWITEAACGLPQ